jgi:hypothetical protein
VLQFATLLADLKAALAPERPPTTVVVATKRPLLIVLEALVLVSLTVYVATG